MLQCLCPPMLDSAGCLLANAMAVVRLVTSSRTARIARGVTGHLADMLDLPQLADHARLLLVGV